MPQCKGKSVMASGARLGAWGWGRPYHCGSWEGGVMQRLNRAGRTIQQQVPHRLHDGGRRRMAGSGPAEHLAADVMN